MAKTKEEYRKEFLNQFQEFTWSPAVAIDIASRYVIDHAEDTFKAADYSTVLEKEAGRNFSFLDDFLRKKAEPGDVPNTIWAAEAVLLTAMENLGMQELPGEVPILHCLVDRINGLPLRVNASTATSPPSTGNAEENYRPVPPGHYPGVSTSLLNYVRGTSKWRSFIQNATQELTAGSLKTIKKLDGAKGWWGQALQSRSEQLADTAAGEKLEGEDATADELLTDEEDRRQERKFQEQCFLIDNYQQICSDNACKDYGKYFTRVGPDASISPSAVISRLVAPQNVDPIMNADPEVFARLQPKVRLFKRFRSKQKPQTKYGAAPDGSDTLIPFLYQPEDKIVQKEIIFSSNDTEKSVSAAFAPRESGYRDGIGLKRFEWTYYGSNPYETDRSISCKLTLFFRNIEDLYAADGTGGGRTSTFLDLILFGPEKNAAPSANPYGVKFNKWDPDYYEIKASVGYQLPNNDELFPKDKTENKDLKDILKRSRVNLGLILTGHTFNFNEDGSGTLEIEFQGIIEAHLSAVRADLFYTSKRIQKEIIKIDKQLDYINSSLEEAGVDPEDTNVEIMEGKVGVADDALDIAGAFIVDHTIGMYWDQPDYEATFVDGDVQALAARKKILEERRARYVRDSKIDRYSALINRLIASDGMRYIDVNRTLMGQISEGREQLARATTAKARLKQSSAGLAITIKKPAQATLREKHKKYLDDASGAVKAQSEGEDKKAAEKSKSAEEVFSPAKGTDLYRVNYFYLGDLFDAAFWMANSNPNLAKTSSEDDYTFSNIKFLMGPITIVDPRTHKPVQINIADLPVSLNLFMTWYLNKVIAPQVDSYYIRNFIRDVITDLALEVLSPDCFFNYPIRPKFNSVSFSAPGSGKIDRVGYKAKGKGGTKKTGHIDPRRVRKLSDILAYPKGLSAANPPREFFYDFIYCQEGIPWNLEGKSSEDSKNGIFHFQIGSDTGILKNVTFDRIDQPHVREARTVSDGADPIVAQLRLQYNVTLKCFGTTIFKPGMRVHVLPRLAGNLQRSLIYKLGLGGYVFITKVENIIEPGRFETILYGINDGMVSRGKKATGDKEPPTIIRCIPKQVEESPAEKDPRNRSTAKQDRSGIQVQSPQEIEADQTGTALSTVQTSKVPDDEL